MKTKDTTKSENSSETNVVSLADYKAKKKTTKDSVKAVFKDSLDNDQVMRRYNIHQPTIEERQEKIKQSIQRINKLMEELKGTNG